MSGGEDRVRNGEAAGEEAEPGGAERGEYQEPGGSEAGDGRRRGSLDREALARLPLHPGLCAGCAHLELQASRRSVFARCGLSDRDPRFPRYPPLPVLACAGYEPLADPDGTG